MFDEVITFQTSSIVYEDSQKHVIEAENLP